MSSEQRMARRRVATCVKCGKRSQAALGDDIMESIGWRKMERGKWWCPFCTGILGPLTKILHKGCAPNLRVAGVAWAPISPTVPGCVMDRPGAVLSLYRESDGGRILDVPLRKVPLFFPPEPQFLMLRAPIKLEDVRIDMPGWATLVWRLA